MAAALSSALWCLVFQNVRLENGTDQFDRWAKVPFPIDFKVYFFEITNPDQFIAGEKAILNQVGPYIYE